MLGWSAAGLDRSRSTTRLRRQSKTAFEQRDPDGIGTLSGQIHPLNQGSMRVFERRLIPELQPFVCLLTEVREVDTMESLSKRPPGSPGGRFVLVPLITMEPWNESTR
jgi:hypothetical protein